VNQFRIVLSDDLISRENSRDFSPAMKVDQMVILELVAQAAEQAAEPRLSCSPDGILKLYNFVMKLYTLLQQ